MRTRLTRLLLAPLLVLVAGAALSLAGSSVASATPPPVHQPFGPTFGSWGRWHSVGFGSHGNGGFGNYTCTSGTVPPGSYNSVLITGVCYMPSGNVTVKNDLTVAPGALLDAVTPGDPTSGTPVVPATVLVNGNIFVGKGAVLLLGCSPNISCSNPPGISFDQVRGSIFALDAQGVVVHSASIGGNVSILGGGGGSVAATCAPQMPPPAPVNPGLAPWSEDPNLYFTPVYTDFEDVAIGGNYTVTGLNTCWLGSLRNQVGGSATFVGNRFGDPDAMEIGNNLINGDLTCFQNDPAPQFGDGAAPDLVAGRGIGQCGFNVVLPNSAPEAIASEGLVGINEHFVVSTRSLGTYFGTHVSTNVGSLPTVTTQAGDQILAELNNFALTGNGLTGSADYTGGPPGQSPGEAFLATQYPDGSVSFVAYDTCPSCSFHGQTGMVTLRAYGTITKQGKISGTFLITSNGVAQPPGTPAPALSNLTGYGSFFGSGSTVNLVEHLGFG